MYSKNTGNDYDDHDELFVVQLTGKTLFPVRINVIPPHCKPPLNVHMCIRFVK